MPAAWPKCHGAGKILARSIVDAETDEGLPGANILIKGSNRGVASNADGSFTLTGFPDQAFTLEISIVGYATQTRSVNGATATEIGEIRLFPSYLLGQEVVISATRKPEKLTEAPASISLITSKDLDELPSFNVGEMLNKIQGVEVVRSGVIGIGLNARGFNSAFNVRMLSLNDGRNGMLPGGTGLPAGFYNTIIKEDIDRVEVVLGPVSALYGPNAHAGVVNTITKDPRTSQGSTVVFGGGNQGVFSTRARQAGVINDKFAYKVNFEYTQGRDFEFVDSVYVNNVGVPELEPDFNFQALRANAAVYYAIGKDSDLILDYGIGRGSNIGVTNLGRNQINDWTFSYLQARYVSPRIFATLYNSWNDAGNTFQINGRTTNYTNLRNAGVEDAEARRRSLLPVSEGGLGFPGFIDRSQRLNGEAQYNNSIGNFSYIAGFSFQRDQANSEGTYLYDIDGDIVINQFGGVLQAEYAFTDNFKFVGAARLDKHDYYDLQFSPRAALTYNAFGGTFRTSFSRAYAAPSIQFLEFLFPFAGGAIIGSGQGLTLESFSTSLVTGVTTAGERRELAPLQPESVQTWEVGYRGNLNKHIYFDITGWRSNSANFLSPAVSLFAVNLPALAIEGERIVARGGQPIPEEFGNLHITYLNYGQVTSWGTDMGLTIQFNKHLSFGAKYMYFNSDITQEDKFEDDANLANLAPQARENLRVLNAPNHRANFNLSARNLAKDKLFLSLSARWVPEYDFISGSQRATAAGAGSRLTGALYDYGPLGGFTTFDFSTGYQINSIFSVGGGISNIFNVDQREFVGSPSIGRLYSAELKINLAKK